MLVRSWTGTEIYYYSHFLLLWIFSFKKTWITFEIGMLLILFRAYSFLDSMDYCEKVQLCMVFLSSQVVTAFLVHFLGGLRQIISRCQQLISQIAQEVPYTKKYQGLLDNVNNEIAFRQQNRKGRKKRVCQMEDWAQVGVYTLIITDVFGFLVNIITDSWAWWVILLIGLGALASLVVITIIVYNCRCVQKLDGQVAKELDDESKGNVNQ